MERARLEFEDDPSHKQRAALEPETWRDPGFETQGGPWHDHPVVTISWNDATAFCESCSLPTEAQWEYACRAGALRIYQWGDDPHKGKEWCNGGDRMYGAKYGLYDIFMWEDGYAETSPVGVFRPNAWGLYDIHGNAFEWRHDWHGDYQPVPVSDPVGPGSGSLRVLRGGSWSRQPQGCRSAFRYAGDPSDRGKSFGLRPVCLNE